MLRRGAPRKAAQDVASFFHRWTSVRLSLRGLSLIRAATFLRRADKDKARQLRYTGDKSARSVRTESLRRSRAWRLG